MRKRYLGWYRYIRKGGGATTRLGAWRQAVYMARKYKNKEKPFL